MRTSSARRRRTSKDPAALAAAPASLSLLTRAYQRVTPLGWPLPPPPRGAPEPFGACVQRPISPVPPPTPPQAKSALADTLNCKPDGYAGDIAYLFEKPAEGGDCKVEDTVGVNTAREARNNYCDAHHPPH